jgi:hypothetical protein
VSWTRGTLPAPASMQVSGAGPWLRIGGHE